MNILVIGKKSLLAFFVLGSIQLVAMEYNTLQKSKNVLLVVEWQRMLQSNVKEYQKKFYFCFLQYQQHRLTYEKLSKARKQLAFFEENLAKLNKATKILGMENVGAMIAYNMYMHKIAQEKKESKHKRSTI
jgi:hypothetical protein